MLLTPFNASLLQGLEDIFTTNEFDYNMDFDRMNNKAQVMKWFEDVLIPNLLPTTDYKGDSLTTLEQGFVGVYNKR